MLTGLPRSRLLVLVGSVLLGAALLCLYSLHTLLYQPPAASLQHGRLLAKYNGLVQQTVQESVVEVKEDVVAGPRAERRREHLPRRKDDYVIDDATQEEDEEEEEEDEEDEELFEDASEESATKRTKTKDRVDKRVKPKEATSKEKKQRVNAAWAAVARERSELTRWQREELKKLKLAQRQLQLDQKRVKDAQADLAREKSALESRRQPTKAPADPPAAHAQRGLGKPEFIRDLNSSLVRQHYPGLTFLPDYKLEEFVPPGQTLDAMTEYEAEERFYKLIPLQAVNCNEMVRMGNSGDGGWDVCVSKPYEPTDNCLVYSFGINNDFSFDDSMASNYDCQVSSFDPSMGVGDHQHAENVYFYQLGLGPANTVNKAGWKLETLGSILSKAGHLTRIIDVLKIDIEYNEWNSFTTMLKEGVLNRVKQLVFEIHTSEVGGVERPSTKQDFERMYNIVHRIETLGFRRFRYHYNPYGKYLSIRTGKQRTCCYELSYININFLKT